MKAGVSACTEEILVLGATGRFIICQHVDPWKKKLYSSLYPEHLAHTCHRLGSQRILREIV